MEPKMDDKLSRREALKLGTSAALSVAAPLFSTDAEPSPSAVSAPKTAMTDSPEEICFTRAVDLMDAIRQKKISAREVMQAQLKQIRRVNDRVNAFVTLASEDSLMAQAAAADEAQANGKWLGP